MISIIIVDKGGTVKDQKVKELSRDILYKKCGFKKDNEFCMRQSWDINDHGLCKLEVWARDIGKAGTENKYELPPPIDKQLYFGSIALVGVDTQGDLTSLTTTQWTLIHEHLFGGFEELSDEESSDESTDDDHVIESVDDIEKDNHTNIMSLLTDKYDEPAEEELMDGSELEKEDYYYSEEEDNE